MEAVERERAILLCGPMGAGKTQVGRALAERLGWEFADTDERVRALAGTSVARIFEREGEGGFREREREALAGLPERRCVAALGGGAVVSEASREIVRRKGRLVWLQASPECLARRLADAGDRPLLAGLDFEGRVARLRELVERRRAAYATADLHVSTEGRSVERVCDALLDALGDRAPQA